MRVAYVGNFEPEFSTENDVRKAFEALGWDVCQLQENRTTPERLLHEALFSDMLLWTSTWDDPFDRGFVTTLVEDCDRNDVVTATYHLDVFHGVSRGGRNWQANPMFQMRNVFTADGGHQAEWEAMGVNHKWLRPGVRHDACEIGTPRVDYLCDVAFVGSDGSNYHPEWPYRTELVDWLEETCARRGWSFRNPGGRREKVLRSADMNDFYASAKVTVGDSLCLDHEDALYWSDRAYEAPGRGGLLIMPRINALAKDYDDHLPMFEWDDFAGLETLIEAFLADGPGRALVKKYTWNIAREEHTYVNRMKELLEEVELS